MMNSRRSLHGATIGIMCGTYQTADLIRASVRGCGGHAILINQFGPVRNATVPLTTDALVIDVNHPGGAQAINTAAATRLPVVACAFGTPTRAVRARLTLSRMHLLIDPDPETVCDMLVSAMGRATSTVKRARVMGERPAPRRAPPPHDAPVRAPSAARSRGNRRP
jgi:hypothetical protein